MPMPHSVYLVPDPLYCWSSWFFSIAVLSFLSIVISFTLSLSLPPPLFPLLSSSSLFPSSFSAHQTSPPFFLDIWLHFQAATRPATRGEAGMKTGRRARLRFHRPERESERREGEREKEKERDCLGNSMTWYPSVCILAGA